MKRSNILMAIACGLVLTATAARAQTLDSLKAELAAKKEDVSKLERRIRRMEVRSSGGVLPPTALPGTAYPAAGPGVPPPAPPPPGDEETEHALEWALVREGALVLPPWTFQITPQFSYA